MCGLNVMILVPTQKGPKIPFKELIGVKKSIPYEMISNVNICALKSDW